MEAWWEEEHYGTDGSSSSAGIAKHGAGRAFVGTASQLSNPTADNDGRLFWVTDTESLYVGQVSSSSWSVVADAIKLSSENTWTALQGFSSGISASNITTDDFEIRGMFSGWTSYSTFTDLASIAADNVRQWTATDGVAANVAEGDFVVMSAFTPFSNVLYTAVPQTNQIVLNARNVGTTPVDPSAQTYTVFIYKAGHLQ